MNGKIYAVGGKNSRGGMATGAPIASIEFLNVLNGATVWEIFTLHEVTARFAPMLGPIDDNRFLVAGGKDARGLLKDAIVVTIDDSLPDGPMGFQRISGTKEDDLGFKIEGRAINMLPLVPGQLIGIAN